MYYKKSLHNPYLQFYNQNDWQFPILILFAWNDLSYSELKAGRKKKERIMKESFTPVFCLPVSSRAFTRMN